MIIKLQVTDPQIAKQILAVQIPAYQIEAKLIGFDQIPQLRETVDSLVKSPLTFYGYIKEEKIVGVIGYEVLNGILEFDRLVVHPDYFRQGIGQSLMQHVFDVETNVHKYLLSTGADNTPALRLYKKLGFIEVKQKEVAPCFFLTFLEKEVKSTTI
ncbi:GNAT family N-acetyltransferase [Thermoflavimicrobium daqui]|uniref:GNAT family N-acetyltransferase n=1 Tax=Thermoflavimicrobium daqui TaxID=2137476 RepID=A0A364K2D6_9BACL|nr:GNAT family N-acetyltransferase [Thermoflavimicrobium daqui]RAL22588.1 GNAT family N-acetyltransferase [Thermoflavimicrobium daqui]